VKTQRVALYARISTKNNGQDPETQLVALREYASHRGMTIIDEYVDIGISGVKGPPAGVGPVDG
jgi:DNA invertase Pin-like site-specific DNA recombinase